MQVNTPLGPIRLDRFDDNLQILTYPAGATGTVTVTLNGVPLPLINLGLVASEETRVLIAAPGHDNGSVGLSWSA